MVAFKGDPFKALVIGAGPAGVAVVGKLMDLGVHPILWVDQSFTCGRLESYHQVPSNTKVSLFLKYGNYFESFRRVWSHFPHLMALKQLETLDPERGCKLAFAADMIEDLSHGLRKVYNKEISCHRGKVKNICKEAGDVWQVDIEGEAGYASFRCERIILATGSHPKASMLCETKQIYLDDALQTSILASKLSPSDTVGVIGSSHSAMLVLKCLCDIPESLRPKKVINFYRSPLKFAEYLPNRIIKHDNTGLKGEVAEWVRTHLVDCQPGAIKIECVDGMMERIDLSSYSDEKEAYTANECDVIISAIGYERNTLPAISVDGIPLSENSLSYDENGFIVANGKKMEGLQGCGIAFPERVLDVDGTPELSVGFWKFIRYIDRIISA